MKNWKYILIAIGFMLPGQSLLHAQELDSTAVAYPVQQEVPAASLVAATTPTEPDTIVEKRGFKSTNAD